QSAYVEQTILSVLEQDYPNIEYLVIDGASTDGSADIIKKYAPRLAYWVSEKDSGQADAINKGMARARGEIVAWLNSDDYYLPGAVTAAVRAFKQNPDVVLIYADMLAVDQNGQTFNTLHYRQLTLEDLLSFQIIGQPAVFMRRAAFENAGGLDLSYHFLLDHHLWIRIAAQGRLLRVPQIWSAARYHPAAKNRAQAAAFGQEAFRILEWAKTYAPTSYLLTPISRRATASAHRVNARYLLDGGQPAASLAAWTRAFFIHPPTALARLNLLGSALLNLVGLGQLREAALKRRESQYRSK
ncbi:MAG: glycosyltransferase family 2 protein, partial [Chloroflexota bacterium]